MTTVTNDTNADPSMLADDTHTRDMLDQLFDAGTRIVAGIGTETDDAIVKLIQWLIRFYDSILLLVYINLLQIIFACNNVMKELQTN